METSKKPPSSFIGLATVQLPYFNSLPIGIIHSLLQSFCVELEKQVRTSSFQRPENQEVFSIPFLAVTTNSICHSTPKISVQYLQKWRVIPVFSLSWHCSMSFFSAWLLNPVRFFAHYFIPLLPCDSPEWKSSSQLLPSESWARLYQYIPVCSVPPSKVQQPQTNCCEVLKQGRTTKALLCIWILSLLLVLPLVSVPSLGHGSA